MFDKVTQFGTSVSRVGSSNMQGLTLMDDEPEYHESPVSEGPAGSHPAEAGSPKAFIVGGFLLLIMLWAIRENSEVFQREVVGINLFNWLTMTTMVVLGIVVFKLIFTRFPVPGITPLVTYL